MSLTIWCNLPMKNEAHAILKKALASHQLFLSQSKATTVVDATPADDNFYKADILFGQPDPAAIQKAPHLKWIHLSTASYTRYDNEAFKNLLRQRHILFSNSSHVYSEPCAQHVLAMILSLTRQLPAAYHNQITSQAWPFHQNRANSHLLNGQTVLFLGFGAIPQRLVQLLTPLEMKFSALKRSLTPRSQVTLFTEEKLPLYLKEADHVINALPDSCETKHFMNALRFSQMKPGSVFYNIGRGATVDQSALIETLKKGHIKAAFIDVTEPEPLPPDHSLWKTPNCFITPHTGGGHANEEERLVRYFLKNLAALEQNQPLSDQIL